MVTLSLNKFAVEASLKIPNAGLIADPLPIPGRPTKTVNRFGYSFHVALEIYTCFLSVADIAVKALQVWYSSGASLVGAIHVI
jgi:hypothetical protein